MTNRPRHRNIFLMKCFVNTITGHTITCSHTHREDQSQPQAAILGREVLKQAPLTFPPAFFAILYEWFLILCHISSRPCQPCGQLTATPTQPVPPIPFHSCTNMSVSPQHNCHSGSLRNPSTCSHPREMEGGEGYGAGDKECWRWKGHKYSNSP